jgi:hypothetical protein
MALTPVGSAVIGYLGSTSVQTITDAAQSYQPTDSYAMFALLADGDIHVSTNGEDATVDDFLVMAGMYVIVGLDRAAGESFSWIGASGISSGTIYITACNRPV